MYPTIDMDTLLKKIAIEGVTLLDVREKMAYDAAHIPAAISCPLPELPDQLAKMSKDKTYHIICRSGNRSAKACAYMAMEGYDVVNVAGGMLDYLARKEG